MKKGIPTSSQVLGEKVLLPFWFFPEVSGQCWNQRSLLAIYVTLATAAWPDGGSTGDSLEQKKQQRQLLNEQPITGPASTPPGCKGLPLPGRGVNDALLSRALNSAVLIVTESRRMEEVEEMAD